jgi:F0F1-type ATP synthase membrane subunit b/b'
VQKERVVELQETNRSLKKLRQQKANQLRQVVSESRMHSCDKFNKFIFALFASKIDLDDQENGNDKGLK